jgi:UDP-2,3-diacylglucosamine pyrophosphatase LpxH
VTKSNWVLWHHPNSPKSELHPDIQNLAIFLITMSTIYRNDFPTAIRTRGLNDTIALNALEKAEKLHGNIFNSKNCFSFLYGTIHREMANKYGIHQKLYVHLSDWETHTSKQ